MRKRFTPFRCYEGTVTRFEYDTLNRLITTTLNYDQGGPINHETNVLTTVSYDALSRRIQTTDGRGKPTSYGYDGLGRTIAITNALNLVTRYSYDGHGNRTQIVNPKSEIVNFQYDAADRLVKTIDPLGHETGYGYNKAGERTEMTDAEGRKTTYDYDDLGRLVGVTENFVDGTFNVSITDEDVKTGYGYDRVGNRTVITDARLNVTTYVYDDLNRRIEMRDPLNHLTQYGYDAVGNRTSLTDANGVVTTFTYDNVNRLTGIDYGDTTPDVSFTYDGAGNRTSMSDGVGQTLYTYDDLYRLTAVSQPSAASGPPAVVGYEYEPVGNRTKLIYPDSREVNYSYDPGNRLETVTDWHNGQFGYNYDEANRLTAVALPNTLSGTGGVTSDYAYDDAGRLTLLAHSTLTDTLASYDYSLDKVGNRRVLTEALVTVENLPAGAYLESDGLVVLEAENGDRTNGTTHNWLLQTATSGYTGTSYLNTSLDNDTLYQTGEITASPKAEYLVDFTTTGTYTVWLRGYPANAASDSAYVGVGDEVTEVTGFSPAEWSWANVTLNNNPATLPVTSTGIYTLSLFMREDGLRIDRLLLTTDTNYIPTGFGPPETERYAAGMALPTVPLTRTIVYTYDNLYRLTEADYSTGEAYAYEYDPVGNRLKQIIDGDTTEYLYDAANRLEQVAVSGQPVTNYTFDDNGNLLTTGAMTNTWNAANRLIASTRDGNTVQPIYNGVNDRVGQTVDGNTTNFALDIAGGLPEVIYTSEGNVYLHLPGVIVAESAAGETRHLLSDGLGSVRQGVDKNGAIITYNEFDPYGNPVEGGGEPYGFTGEWWQAEVGLLHLRARWLMPETGTFLSVDPVESEPPYLYVRGNPVSLLDPSGLEPEWWDTMLQDDYWRQVLFESTARHNKTQMTDLEFASLMAAIIKIESGALRGKIVPYPTIVLAKSLEIWYNRNSTIMPKLSESTGMMEGYFGYHTEGLSNTRYDTILNLQQGLVPDATGTLQKTDIEVYEYSDNFPGPFPFPGLTELEQMILRRTFMSTQWRLNVVANPFLDEVFLSMLYACIDSNTPLQIIRQDQNIEYLAANLEAGAIRARWEGVEPTAERLSWWQHQGFVTMQDKFKIQLDIDNLGNIPNPSSAQIEYRKYLQATLDAQGKAERYWFSASWEMQNASELLRR